MNLLVVEDDKETLNFLKSSLKAEGFVVDTAEDGNDGSCKASVTVERDYLHSIGNRAYNA